MNVIEPIFNMDKVRLILFLYLVVANCGYTQQNLRTYYVEISKAEDCIISDKYEEAAIHYKKAIDNKDFGFERDLKNAIFCEIQTGYPNRANCQKYSTQLAKHYGINIAWYYKDFPEVDTTIFSNQNAHKNYINYIFLHDTIRKMEEKDQLYRRNDTLYDTDLRETYPKAFENINKKIRMTDSLNIAQFKQLIKKYDMFDERVISFDELSTLFNHWFLIFPHEQDYFLPLMRQAVEKGVMDAYNYEYACDINYWRTHTENPTFSPMGGTFLTIYNVKGNKRPKDIKYIAFSYYNANNPVHKKWFMEVNRKRANIFLDNAETSAIRNLKLFFKFIIREDYARIFEYRSISLKADDGIFLLKEALRKNPKLKYYTNLDTIEYDIED